MTCQDRRPHCGQRRYWRGRPVAFQRMPPKSQIDWAKPQRQRIIQARESASIDSAQLRGRILLKNRWIRLIVVTFVMWFASSSHMLTVSQLHVHVSG